MKKQNHEEEFDQMEYTHNGGAGRHVFTGLLIGGVVGAVTMLLFAPRSGEETRAEIRDKALELRDRTTETVKDTVSQAKSKAYELKDTVWEKADELAHRGKLTAREKLERVSEVAETGSQRVQEY